MSIENFTKTLSKSPRPVVVDFWASWCVPCKAIEPALDKLKEQYHGRVDLLKVNADENPDVLQSLRIYGIPTLVAFRNGKEVARRTGAASASILSGLFESALSGEKPKKGLTSLDRILRLIMGAILIALAFSGGLTGWHWLLAGLGAVVAFSAVYDRCPIYKAVSQYLRSLFTGKDAAGSR